MYCLKQVIVFNPIYTQHFSACVTESQCGPCSEIFSIDSKIIAKDLERMFKKGGDF